MCVCVFLQDDVEKISGKAYMVFGIVLFFWEFVPTTLLVVFFRVQRPNQNLVRHPVALVLTLTRYCAAWCFLHDESD